MKKFKIAYTVCYVCAGLLFGVGCAVLAWAYCDVSWRIAYLGLDTTPASVLWYLLAFLPAVAAVAILGYLLEQRYKETLEQETNSASEEPQATGAATASVQPTEPSATTDAATPTESVGSETPSERK